MHAKTYKHDKYVIKKFPGHLMNKYATPVYLGEDQAKLISGREAVESEISKLRVLARAKNVVKLVDVRENSDHSIELVFESAGDPVLRWIGNRYFPISRIKADKYLAADTRNILRQILSGVSEIHQAGIVHKDLQPGNILADDRLQIAICDFGSAAIVDTIYPIIFDAKGTLEFTPPEILLHGKGDGFKRDTWSIGIVFFIFLTGRLPWFKRTESEIVEDEISRPQEVEDDQAWELLHGLTLHDVDKRWSVNEAISSKYLSSV
jgi:serine/threonine protein kinase